ncbi:MAG TPA: immunoglobulin domain-containing protein, partial [Candidatus Binatia bacterium]|nr:immunoglobulin domain-containing protein [Candidatus Binatia bacterium]
MSAIWIWVFSLTPVAPAHAQQVSYSIQLQPGVNSIANHVINGANRLDDILPNLPEGSALYKFNHATQTYYEPAQVIAGFGWFTQEPEMEYLNPGEGAFLFVDHSNVITFRGGIAQIPLPRPAVFGGYNFVSAHQPRTMSFAELFGFPPADGDVVYLYDFPFAAQPQGDPAQGASSLYRFKQGWDNIAPLFRRGRSAFVRLSRAPRIIVQPKSHAATNGQTLRLDVSLLGKGPFAYQWQFNDDDITGETNAFLLFNNIQFLQSGLYSVTIRNSEGETTSKPATIRVSSLPVILDPPEPVRTTGGQTNEFRVYAVGTPPLRYQWFQNNQQIPSGTNEVVNIPATQSVQSSQIYVKVINTLGFAQSEPVFLEVNEPPTITRQPASQSVFPNESAMFAVAARGTPPLKYQWRRNGRNISGATDATFMILHARPADSGSYDVVIANIAGTAHSEPVELTVVVPPIFLADRMEDSGLFTMPAFTARGDNLKAHNESNEVHCARQGGSSVWMRWKLEADTRGIVRFETSGSTFDTILAAYTRDATGQMIPVVCDDDEGEFLGSRIQFAAAPGTIYFIAIDGVDGARGEIVLDWHLDPTLDLLPVIVEQPRDETARPGGVATFFVDARSPSGAPLRYQWFRNGEELFNQTAALLQISPVEDEDLGYYYVEVSQDQQTVRSRRAFLQVSLADMDSRVVQAFAVDKFADALDRRAAGSGGVNSILGTAFTPVIGYTGTQIFSTVGFSGEPGELSHCGIPGGSSAWFTFVPPTNGTLYLDSAGSSFNTVLAVYTGPGPTIASLTPLICDNDNGPGTTSSLNFPAIKNTTYYIALDGYNGVTGTAHLNYRLLVPMSLERVSKTNDTDCRLRVTATPSYPFTIQRCSGFQT